MISYHTNAPHGVGRGCGKRQWDRARRALARSPGQAAVVHSFRPQSSARITPDTARTLAVRIAFSARVSLRGVCGSATSLLFGSLVFISKVSKLVVRAHLRLLLLEGCELQGDLRRRGSAA